MTYMVNLKRMSNTCVLLLLLVSFVTCIFSSYLDIPSPPRRPDRFKTREQIEDYLKAVKDYYDAFKIKLVRRQDALTDLYTSLNVDNENNQQDEDENQLLFSGDSTVSDIDTHYKTYHHYRPLNSRSLLKSKLMNQKQQQPLSRPTGEYFK